jgi:hypothetical protein
VRGDLGSCRSLDRELAGSVAFRIWQNTERERRTPKLSSDNDLNNEITHTMNY